MEDTEKKIKTDIGTLFIKDNICHIEYKENMVIDLKAAHKIVSHRLELTNGHVLPCFADASKIKGITQEARSYFSSDEALKGLKAGGLLTDSTFTKLLGNFFLTVNFTLVPFGPFINFTASSKRIPTIFVGSFSPS